MRRSLLIGIICAALLALFAMTNFYILPFGTYKGVTENEVFGSTVKTEYAITFALDGSYKLAVGGVETEGYYKVKGGEILVSSEKGFEAEDGVKLCDVNNFMSLTYDAKLIEDIKLTNMVMVITEVVLGLLVVANVLLFFSGSKKRR